MPAISVSDVPAQERYVIEADDAEVGFVTYRLDGGVIALMHAEVDYSKRDQGLASRLIEFALDDARSRGLAVLPFCPFVRSYIADHAADYLDLVPADARGRFGL
jgi:predicted GNAT family acetyltransferase